MEINSSESYEEEFESNEIEGRQSIFPSKSQIIIILLICLVLLIMIEKIFIRIFLYFIPSYIFLILTLIILHIFLLRYLVYTSIYPGKNYLVESYLRKYYGRNRAKLFGNSLEHFKNRIDKILQSNNNSENDKINSNISTENKSKVSSKYADIYLKIKEYYGNLNKYETELLNKLLSLKACIENSSLQDNFNKYIDKKQIILSKKDISDYENIKIEASNIQQLLNEFRGEIEFNFNFSNLIKYIKNYFFNDIFSSKNFYRINILMKNPNSKEIKIINNDNLEIDCFLIYSDKEDKNAEGENEDKEEENEENKTINKNLVIICGPNLTPFESFINSWNLDSLYLSNNTDILFWNYRGYGFSEGSANFTNACQDILTIYDYITQNFKYNKIAVHGLSIGGISSCHLAANRPIDLLIADRTFGSVQGFLDSFSYGNKILYYLAKILLIPFVNNTNNFMRANCKKILLNDPEDTTINDNFSLKTSISKKIIFDLFNRRNPELNIRNIKSNNILDYALEPEQSKEIFNSFKYTINYLKNKSKYFINNNNNNKEDFPIEIRNKDDDMKQKLNENKILDNIDINNISLEILQNISNNFYKKIFNLYSKFYSAGDYLIKFTEYMNTPAHFNNFFNNLFIYGSEDLSKLDFYLCNINNVDEMLNKFIQEANNFLNSNEIKQFVDYNIYKHFSFFVECINNFKIFLSGLHLENYEQEYFLDIKGTLIPLSCGHILFYKEGELETLKYLIKEWFTGNNINIQE